MKLEENIPTKRKKERKKETVEKTIKFIILFSSSKMKLNFCIILKKTKYIPSFHYMKHNKT